MNDGSQSAADPPAPRASTGIRGRLRGFLSARLDPKACLELDIGTAATQLGSPLAMGALLVASAAVGEVLKLAGPQTLAGGLSRIFLAVHYPSDVLGACAAGAVWMALSITGVHIARPRQIVRQHPTSVAVGTQVQPTLP
jgi:hypothetical protein